MASPPRPLFLDGPRGPLFGVLHAPPSGRREALVYVPPLAEEANRARRMVHLLGRRLVEQGVGLLLLDPHGTGDSAGDFADATWDGWRADVAAGCAWLRGEGFAEVGLLGLRLGGCLALEAAAVTGPSRVVLWQPVTRGATYLNQFLRIRVAAGLGGAADGETTKDLKARFASGEVVEIGGYPMPPELAASIEQLDLTGLGRRAGCAIAWLQVGGGELPPAAARAVEAWRADGLEASARVVPGEAFWSIEETTLVPGLIDATAALWETAR